MSLSVFHVRNFTSFLTPFLEPLSPIFKFYHSAFKQYLKLSNCFSPSHYLTLECSLVSPIIMSNHRSLASSLKSFPWSQSLSLIWSVSHHCHSLLSMLQRLTVRDFLQFPGKKKLSTSVLNSLVYTTSQVIFKT